MIGCSESIFDASQVLHLLKPEVLQLEACGDLGTYSSQLVASLLVSFVGWIASLAEFLQLAACGNLDTCSSQLVASSSLVRGMDC